MNNAGSTHESVAHMKEQITTAAEYRQKARQWNSLEKVWRSVAGHYGISVDCAYKHYRDLLLKEGEGK